MLETYKKQQTRSKQREAEWSKVKQSRENLNKRMHKHAKTSKRNEKLAKSCKNKQNKMQSHKEKMNTQLAHGCDLSGADVLFFFKDNTRVQRTMGCCTHLHQLLAWLTTKIGCACVARARAANFFFNQLNILSKVSEFEGQATVCVFRNLKTWFCRNLILVCIVVCWNHNCN